MIGVAILAAGRGLRFPSDRPKQLQLLHGRLLIEYAFAAARASELQPRFCVVSDDRVAAIVPDDFVIARNDAPEHGISSSLHAAIGAAGAIDALVIALADQPLVGARAYQRLAASYAEGARLAYATYDGQRGNPVLIAREHFADAFAIEGDQGGRALFGRHDARAVPCDGTGTPADVDTPEDLARLEHTWKSPTASE